MILDLVIAQLRHDVKNQAHAPNLTIRLLIGIALTHLD